MYAEEQRIAREAGRLNKSDDDRFKDVCRKVWPEQTRDGEKCTKTLLLTELYTHLLHAEKDIKELKASLSNITKEVI